MTRRNNDRNIPFSDVVTIDAWHQSFEGRSKVDLHADVVFGTGKVGAEDEAPVRFQLSVRRAELVVVVPEFEPVSIDTSSVSRDAPKMTGQLKQIINRKNKATGRASGSVKSANFRIIPSVTLEGDIEGSQSNDSTLSLSRDVDAFLVTQSQTGEGHYRWALEPTLSTILVGRPWDAAKSPRLKLIDKRKDRSRTILACVRVEVRCRREDLHITEIKVKNDRQWKTLKARYGFRNRLAAAEAYIRDRIFEEGLAIKNITDPYGQLTLANIIAQETGD